MSRLASIAILVGVIGVSFALSAIEISKYNLHPQTQTAALSGVGSELIAHYTFDEGSGTTANDSAGSNTGTINGATWTSGKVGGALEFDGNDHITFNEDLPNSYPFTFSGWVKTLANTKGSAVSSAASDRVFFSSIGVSSNGVPFAGNMGRWDIFRRRAYLHKRRKRSGQQ